MTLPYAYKITLSYDGTRYGGWQVQPNSTTIQQLLQTALTTSLQTPTHATGAGRTDAGVHALGQCAHFHTAQAIDCRRLCASLNGLLPADIRILSIETVPADFHARYSATGKCYRYYLTLTPQANPFTRLYSWHLPMTYDRERVMAAAEHLIGTHDFRSFANQKGCDPGSTVRTLTRITPVETDDGLYYEFEGPGFLYKMVRNLMGTLVEVALGKRHPDTMPALLAACDRRAAGTAAPPQGLFLVSVHY
jgi:tRNA pseudouridine38-40 synthase